MTTKQARLQRLEADLARWLRECPTEELMRYLPDDRQSELASQAARLKSLSNAQLLRLYNGEPLSTVLSQERAF